MSPTDARGGFSKSPLFWLSIAFAAGIAAGSFIQPPWQFSLAIAVGFAIAAAVLSRSTLAVALLGIAFLFAGSFAFEIGAGQIPENRIKRMFEDGRIAEDDVAEIEGSVKRRPEETFGGFFVEVESTGVIIDGAARRATGLIRVFVPAAAGDVSSGERLPGTGSTVRFPCRLSRSNKYNNPGGVSRAEILDAKSVDATCALKSGLLLETTSNGGADSALSVVFVWREWLIDQFRQRLSVSAAGVMIASLLGSKEFLDRRTAELFRDGGTFHVLVISGLHITFIGGLTLLVVRCLTRRRTLHFLLATSFLWAFSIAVGAEIPVVRAAVMFTVLLFSQVVQRRGNLLNSLGFCGLAMLGWRPEDLFTQSFQLTFLSVTALVGGAFPLIEKLRAIGAWQPTSSTPFPPDVSSILKRFCESLYWNEERRAVESTREIWSGTIVKKPFFPGFFRRRFWRIAVRYLFEGVVLSTIVQIWLLPLSVIFFNRVTFASVFLNLWVGAFIALESFTAVAAVAVAEFNETTAVPFVLLTEVFNELLLLLPKVLIDNDLAGFRVPAYSGACRIIYAAFYLPVIVFSVAVWRWRPLDPQTILSNRSRLTQARGRKIAATAALAATLLIALIAFHPFSAPAADGRLSVDFIDVGQGDSALVTFPNGQTMLIDGGGRPVYGTRTTGREGNSAEVFERDSATVGETVVSRFLWSRGYSKIDYIVATHADADHIQGLAAVIRNFRVGAAWVGRTPASDEDYVEFHSELTRRSVPLTVVKRGDTIRIGGAEVEILYPDADQSAGAFGGNNNSVVVRIGFGGRKFLFTGDIERETENLLVRNASITADVVKVAHHGSRTSSTQSFIDAINPEYAVISVGRTSQFGHPHADVVERWRNSGAEVLTTGERGTITVSTDGSELLVKRFLP